MRYKIVFRTGRVLYVEDDGLRFRGQQDIPFVQIVNADGDLIAVFNPNELLFIITSPTKTTEATD